MKYQLGQEVYFLSNNKVDSSTVQARKLIEYKKVSSFQQSGLMNFIGDLPQGSWYLVRDLTFSESQLFNSKQELLDSL